MGPAARYAEGRLSTETKPPGHSQSPQPSHHLPLVDLLARFYGARGARLRPIYEHAKAMYVVDRRDGGRWILRLYPAARPIERLRGQAAILRHVARYSIPAERVVPTLEDELSTTLDNRGVLVTTFIEGVSPNRTPTVLHSLGEAIGRLHALPTAPPDDPYLTRRAGALPREDLAFGRARLARIRDRVPASHRATYEALYRTLRVTRDCEDLPPAAHGLIHSDCHLANALQTPDGGVSLFDWDGAGHGPRVAALGLLLYSCAIQAPDEPDPNTESTAPIAPSLVTDRVEAVLAGYHRHHRLSTAELDYLPDAARFRPAVIAARALADAVERDEPPDDTGWWTRYAEADLVAECARRLLELMR